MAALNESSKAAGHVRTISLPSKKHPVIASIEEQLIRLRASEATSSSVPYKLGGLKDLYERVDDLLQLPSAQQALSHELHSKSCEEMLDGSLRLLEVCDTSRDVFSQTKECVCTLESSFLRKGSGELSLENEVGAYMISRKRLNQVTSKCVKSLKITERTSTASSLDKDLDSEVVVSILKEVEDISLGIFESVISLISRPKARSRPAGWSLVSKVLKSRSMSCQGQADFNEIEKMEAELLALIGKKSSLEQVQNILKGLEALQLSIQEVEEELQCVYRQLLKTRVSLLNIFNN